MDKLAASAAVSAMDEQLAGKLFEHLRSAEAANIIHSMEPHVAATRLAEIGPAKAGMIFTVLLPNIAAKIVPHLDVTHVEAYSGEPGQ
jgi:flagellar motility protein MotE (MotC chaperone)